MWRSAIELRALHAGHRQAVALHLLALSADDRIARFGLALKDVAILRWAERVDWATQRWWGAWLPDDMGLAATLQLAPGGRPGVWELALSVAPPLRRAGVGSALVAAALAATPALRALVCYHGHPAMRAIARRLGCPVRAQRQPPRLMLWPRPLD